MDRQIVRSKDRLCADKTAAIIGIRQASLSALEASSAHRRQSACRSTRQPLISYAHRSRYARNADDLNFPCGLRTLARHQDHVAVARPK
jgi:hypothetical protein